LCEVLADAGGLAVFGLGTAFVGGRAGPAVAGPLPWVASLVQQFSGGVR
jgi:hypothetical protein